MRLKEKLGDRSNASSEVEYRGALGQLVGEEGRGIAAIMNMVALTRADCVLGSAGQVDRVHVCVYLIILTSSYGGQWRMQLATPDAFGQRFARAAVVCPS